MTSSKTKEFVIALACLVLPACVMSLLPFLCLLWAAIGAVLLWPVASLLPGDDLEVFYGLWVAYYLLTCIVLWLVVQWVRKLVRKRAVS